MSWNVSIKSVHAQKTQKHQSIHMAHALPMKPLERHMHLELGEKYEIPEVSFFDQNAFCTKTWEMENQNATISKWSKILWDNWSRIKCLVPIGLTLQNTRTVVAIGFDTFAKQIFVLWYLSYQKSRALSMTSDNCGVCSAVHCSVVVGLFWLPQV